MNQNKMKTIIWIKKGRLFLEYSDRLSADCIICNNRILSRGKTGWMEVTFLYGKVITGEILIIEGNDVYELDEECLDEKEKGEK